MASTPPTPIGRVRLSDIAGDWSRTQALNPRLLATEVAGVLRSVAQGEQQLESHHYSLTMFDLSTGAGGLTYWALADYFDSLSSEHPSSSIQTTTGPTPAGAVLLAYPFIALIVNDATKRAATAAGFVVELLPAPTATGNIQRQNQQPIPPLGSSTEVLAAHQAQLRQEGEQRASELLDTAEQRSRHLQRENDRLKARLATVEGGRQEAAEDAEQHRRAAQEERRQRTLAEEQLKEYAGIIAFMDTGNPLAPVEGQRMVVTWCALTNNGQTDPTAESGIGLGELSRRWWKEHFGEPPAIVAKHLQWALTWPSRKKGGAVAKKPTEKG